jgi:hypothetical protein
MGQGRRAIEHDIEELFEQFWVIANVVFDIVGVSA